MHVGRGGDWGPPVHRILTGFWLGPDVEPGLSRMWPCYVGRLSQMRPQAAKQTKPNTERQPLAEQRSYFSFFPLQGFPFIFRLNWRTSKILGWFPYTIFTHTFFSSVFCRSFCRLQDASLKIKMHEDSITTILLFKALDNYRGGEKKKPQGMKNRD